MEGISEMTREEPKQGWLQGLELWKGGSRLLGEPESLPCRGVGTWVRGPGFYGLGWEVAGHTGSLYRKAQKGAAVSPTGSQTWGQTLPSP